MFFISLIVILLLVSSYAVFLSSHAFEENRSKDVKIGKMEAAQPAFARRRGLQPEALYYDFEEGRGNLARDLSISGGNDGTLHGVSFSNDAKHGRWSLRVPGGDQNRVQVGGPLANLDMPNAYTFMCWFKVNSGSQKGLMMFGDCCTNRNGYTMNLASSSQIRFWGGSDNDNSNYNTYANGLNLANSQWHHVAIRCNMNNLQIYVDGVLKVTGAKNVPTSPRRAQGSHCPTDPCVGGKPISANSGADVLIDDAAIFSRYLSQQEILEAMEGMTSIPSAENVELVNPTGDDKICYAQYQPYNLTLNVSTMDSLDEVSNVKVHLDYNTTNATLCYNWTQGKFFKLQDEVGTVQLLINDCFITNNGVDRWYLNFILIFNFTFPHEELIDCLVFTTAKTGEYSVDRFPWLFRIENDLDFFGTADYIGEYQGALREEAWIQGEESINLSNITVQYAGSIDIFPHDDYYDVKLSDSSGRTWWDNESRGENVEIIFTSGNITDEEEEYLITIENIPGTGICMTNLTFAVKIDADPPLFPVNLQCRAGGFKDKETENTKLAEMYVTWDRVEDPASGLLGYYFSGTDKSGTINGSFINDTEIKIDKLDEGFAEIYVWCIDMVGNIGDAATSGILVDLTPPVFSNFSPQDGSWHNHTDVECSIEIYDGEGSGVDGSSIEYSISSGSEHGFDFWIPAWIPEVSEPMMPDIKYIFHEGEDNYIKWRAKDISGNGFTESPSINIKVDVTPVNFANVISPETEWYKTNTITSSIIVRDAGSGVDPGSLEARISTSGPGDFGGWMSIDAENIIEDAENSYKITVTFDYAEGKDNFLMFRGTDLVGNPFTLSDKFNLKIDRSPVHFGSFTPLEDEYADSNNVECFIQIFDDGTGVDPVTIEYSISNGGGDDENNYGPWKKVINVVDGNPTQVLLELEFDWGTDNYIRWRADDLMGTGYNISIPYRVWVNSRPDVVISAPDEGSLFRFDSVILFDASASFDEDGDNLSYYWTSNVSANRSLGTGAVMNARLAPGKHTITVFVSDGHGYNESEKIKIAVSSSADYEMDSDGDGFSDGFERESGTDPNNGEDSPEGEPDIVNTESAGILGEGSSMLFIILGGILALIIVVLIILIIVRKKKNGKKDVPPSSPPPFQQSPYGPSSHPYPQGQHMYTGKQGYGAAPQPQRHGGMPGMQFSQLMLPPGPGLNVQQSGGGSPNQFGQPQLPQYGQSSQQTPNNQAGQGMGTVGSTAYSLPSFSTEQGPQYLERMALPPGPSPSDQTIMNPAPPTQITTPDLAVQPFAFPIVGAMETPFPLPEEPLIPMESTPQFPPEPIPKSPDTPPLELPDGPPPDPSQTSDLSELDAYLSTLGDMAEAPEPIPQEPPGPPPMLPNGASPEPETKNITMQCHSCGNNYNAEISELPSLVTCTVCQTQGAIESL
jgi:hypothetical protein